MRSIQYSVPGSMIIFGEYYITEKGNNALCCAVDKRASITINFFEEHEADLLDVDVVDTDLWNGQSRVVIESIYHGERFLWKNPNDCALFDIAQKLYEEFGALFSPQDYYDTGAHARTHKMTVDSPVALVKVLVDTHNFFVDNEDGGAVKLGLGSSEASAVLFTILVLVLHHHNPMEDKLALASYAAKVHYVWQGNRGSGYGVYASIFGGLGFFHQANAHYTRPSWEAVGAPHNIYWYYMKGKKSNISKHAISKFNDWKVTHQGEYLQVKEAVSQHMARVKKDCGDVQALCMWLEGARQISEKLGSCIGIESQLDIMPSDKDIVWKATGAGNESAIGISPYFYQEIYDDVPYICGINLAEGLQEDACE